MFFPNPKIRDIAFSLGIVCFLAQPAVGQVSTDSTTGSIVTPANNSFTVNGGHRAGDNLFHSFRQLTVPTGSVLQINNELTIKNIFSRVTGGLPSEINGVIRANGNANVFLLNPNGILFGPNAQLLIGGSFYGTTANSIRFVDGTSFSATPRPNGTPLLSANLPSQFIFEGIPGTITVRRQGHDYIGGIRPFVGAGQQGGLSVLPGNTFSLIGGNVLLEGGVISVASGAIIIGAAERGIVTLSPLGSNYLIAPQPTTIFGNIALTTRSALDVSGIGGGSIQIWGKDVRLTDGSLLLNQNFGNLNSLPIEVRASSSLFISGTDPIARTFGGIASVALGMGSGADIDLQSPRITVTEGATAASISLSQFQTGRAGNINIMASEYFHVLGVSPRSLTTVSSLSSFGLFSGSAGNINIQTSQLFLRDGGLILSATAGSGSSGAVTVTARDIEISGIAPLTRIPSGIGSTSIGVGNAQRVLINTTRLSVLNGGRIDSSAIAEGNGGGIFINAAESILVSGRFMDLGSTAIITSSASTEDPILLAAFPQFPAAILRGNAGTVAINTGLLQIINNGVISVRNDGPGSAGDLILNTNQLRLNNGNIIATTLSGTGGSIRISSSQQISLDKAAISATAGGLGSGGSVGILTPILITQRSNITANAQQSTGGQINITSQGIFNINTTISATSERGPQFSGIVLINSGNQPFVEPDLLNLNLKDPEIQPLCQKVNNPRLAVQSLSGQMIPVNPIANSQPSWSPPTPNTIPPTENPTVTPAVSWKTNSDGTISFIAAEEYLERLQNKVCKSK
jgi:filamentous hemagglutinin family protein